MSAAHRAARRWTYPSNAAQSIKSMIQLKFNIGGGYHEAVRGGQRRDRQRSEERTARQYGERTERHQLARAITAKLFDPPGPMAAPLRCGAYVSNKILIAGARRGEDQSGGAENEKQGREEDAGDAGAGHVARPGVAAVQKGAGDPPRSP